MNGRRRVFSSLFLRASVSLWFIFPVFLFCSSLKKREGSALSHRTLSWENSRFDRLCSFCFVAAALAENCSESCSKNSNDSNDAPCAFWIRSECFFDCAEEWSEDRCDFRSYCRPASFYSFPEATHFADAFSLCWCYWCSFRCRNRSKTYCCCHNDTSINGVRLKGAIPLFKNRDHYNGG
jgi:hypothetical protein